MVIPACLLLGSEKHSQLASGWHDQCFWLYLSEALHQHSGSCTGSALAQTVLLSLPSPNPTRLRTRCATLPVSRFSLGSECAGFCSKQQTVCLPKYICLLHLLQTVGPSNLFADSKNCSQIITMAISKLRRKHTKTADHLIKSSLSIIQWSQAAF